LTSTEAVQGASEDAVQQDCLEGLAAVAARFGAHVPDHWAAAEALLAVIEAGEAGQTKRALACLRARPVLHLFCCQSVACVCSG
jgi:hypothetical protein